MNFTTLRNGTALAVAILGISGFIGQAQAQTVITANLDVDSAITVVAGNDIEFGTWLLVYRNADAFTLDMVASTGVTTPAGLGGGPTNSVAIELVAGTGAGDLTVELPAGANGVVINMTRGVITDMPSTALTLQNITYNTVTENDAAFAQTINHPVTVITGGVPETVSFGATVAVGGQPVDGPHSGTFTVNFAY